MFERNRIDNVEQHNGVAVEILTDTGEQMAGRLMLAVGRSLFDVLNSPGGFVEFEPWGGERTLVAKSALRNVKLTNVARGDGLKARLAATDEFDPFAVLGVAPGAAMDEVKSAWHRLSKTYHPDRYASAELPEEVMRYLSIMARRVNTAYSVLETQLQAQRKTAALRMAPVYTSRPRA